MIEESVVSSSSSHNPEWQKVNEEIKRISGLKHLVAEELRREYYIFDALRNTPRRKTGITIRREESPRRGVIPLEELPVPKAKEELTLPKAKEELPKPKAKEEFTVIIDLHYKVDF